MVAAATIAVAMAIIVNRLAGCSLMGNPVSSTLPTSPVSPIEKP